MDATVDPVTLFLISIAAIFLIGALVTIGLLNRPLLQAFFANVALNGLIVRSSRARAMLSSKRPSTSKQSESP